MLVETPHDDADFDLDIRLQALESRISADPNLKPTDGACTWGCPTGATNCTECPRLQD